MDIRSLVTLKRMILIDRRRKDEVRNGLRGKSIAAEAVETEKKGLLLQGSQSKKGKQAWL